MNSVSAKAAVNASHFDGAYKAALRAAATADHSSLPHREQLGLAPERANRRSSFRKVAGALRRGDLNALSRLISKEADAQARGFDLVSSAMGRWRWLYDAVSDDTSRDILIFVLAYRALGWPRVRMPLNTEEYWRQAALVEKALSSDDRIPAPDVLDQDLARISLAEWGFDIDLYSRTVDVLAQFVCQQYRCETAAADISPSAGEVALDCGACFGDTALNFASKVEPQGRVFTFEFLPVNLAILARNLELNPELADRISIVESPVWSEHGTPLWIHGDGPRALVNDQEAGADGKATTVSIDQFVAERDLDRVDFIKMDIEGAELDALRGAAETLRRFKPRLAICLYHRLSDIHEIPWLIDQMGLGYRLHIRHFTVYGTETVLFADAR